MTTVSVTCLKVTCRNTKMEFKPDGHNNKYPSLITILCPMCNTTKFMCNRSCTTGTSERHYKQIYGDMRQEVRRHHSTCHKVIKGIRHQQPSSDESMEQKDNDSSPLKTFLPKLPTGYYRLSNGN